ncbi:UDP-N-acetylmuramoylalanyl-D-glutamyl-2,6-diaminopimelate--D-alanyl-D-alanine ligase [Oricola cellulosilytica]|uniref:UDP-N-acetylmuramoyl-tripeptide--D-alanyl-D-alanine ligase n=1 Tax=Oricola cellulosilytica TaxID=1429082 RepID=A0A4R0PDD6_9HYPH|nr:UDP-N-acetylmuramoylalanyl-D-glutamyl-2,6-diaminopimelate--D-alanyl-D-alanine ligase [Oricola cellulosilytica]TCD15510.1 UDP-N-acetylmuramoylalanyl-D-glutamyl-2,6-diaminopimelate--D-alanyl-D-alanine ligase [Oricola cellulosilytica]
MAPLWIGQDMVDAMNARPVNGVPANVTGVSIDSRTLKPGEAFFAIKGDKFDGHDYATAAAAAGASVLVIAENKLPALGRLTVPMMVVSDVLDALWRLGAAARARSKARIIAVTGSAGKTTTKDALRHVLAHVGPVHASVASFNNHWGVPLTLARMPERTKFGIFEIGMNHPGEITPLVKLVRPHIAIITLVAAAHLGHFKDLNEIAHAKAEIFEGLVSGGWALINRDDAKYALLEKLARKAGVENVAGFGAHERAKVRLTNAKYLDECSTITASVFGEEIAAKIGLPGRHIVQNVLAILGAAHLAGADMAKVCHALASIEAERGRGQRHTLRAGKGTFTLIDESYNANPASMEAALELLSSAQVGGRGRRIAVLGDMLELGRHSAELHSGLAGPIANAGIDRLYLAGPEIKVLADAVPNDIYCEYERSVDDLIDSLMATPQPGDVIMIKSSNGIGFSRIVRAMLDRYSRAEA